MLSHNGFTAAAASGRPSAVELLDGVLGDRREEVDEVAVGIADSRMERLPHGIVVGCCTHSLTIGFSRSYSPSTSSTLNSMITPWFSAGRAESSPKSCVVWVWPIASVKDGMISSANSGV
jgi:hypothetical protein